MRRAAAILLAASAVAAMAATSARAAEMRLSYVASVRAIGGVNAFAGDGLGIGDRFTVSYTFDTLRGEVLSTPYHALQITPAGTIDYGYFGRNEIAYPATGSGPVAAGLVGADIAFDDHVVALDTVDGARVYASRQPGAEGYLAVELSGALPGGRDVQLTDAIFATGVVPLLSQGQSVAADGNPAATSVIFTGDGAVLGTLESATLEAVPEPSGWALMIAGLGAVGGSMRRRRGYFVRSCTRTR